MTKTNLRDFDVEAVPLMACQYIMLITNIEGKSIVYSEISQTLIKLFLYLLYFCSGLAVDGNKENNNPAFCSITGHQANPWWAVDLGIDYLVQTAYITNRGDDYGLRLFTSSSELHFATEDTILKHVIMLFTLSKINKSAPFSF